MILLALLVAFDGRTVCPLELGTLTVAQARRLDGRHVLAVIEVEVPPFTHSGGRWSGSPPATTGPSGWR